MSKAAKTRSTILKEAFGLIYTQGYQPTSIDDIIAKTKLTKGAFFYHFKSKDEMGKAIIDEVIRPAILSTFTDELEQMKDPLSAIYTFTKELLFETPELLMQYGCPAGNMIQEMTPWNKEFTNMLSEIMNEWQASLEKLIVKGKKEGMVKKDVNPKQVAIFLISGYWGVRNLAKVHNSHDPYKAYLKGLKVYLDAMK